MKLNRTYFHLMVIAAIFQQAVFAAVHSAESFESKHEKVDVIELEPDKNNAKIFRESFETVVTEQNSEQGTKYFKLTVHANGRLTLSGSCFTVIPWSSYKYGFASIGLLDSDGKKLAYVCSELVGEPGRYTHSGYLTRSLVTPERLDSQCSVKSGSTYFLAVEGGHVWASPSSPQTVGVGLLLVTE